MVIVDTAVWIDHIRRPLAPLAQLLAEGEIVQHPMITGEIALGSIKPREALLRFLQLLPSTLISTDADVLVFIDEQRLFGTGIGYVDAHLLAACINGGHKLWTRDKRLAAQADRLAVSYEPDI